jgi:MtN3 and saliva related transmembrane protein
MNNVLSNPLTIGIAAGILTAISSLPQLLKMIKKKKAEDVSIGMLIVLILGVGLWIYYGALKKDLPILITNCFSILVNLLLLFLSIWYKSKSPARRNR